MRRVVAKLSVLCCGTTHRIGLRSDLTLVYYNHNPNHTQHHRLFAELGGELPSCLQFYRVGDSQLHWPEVQKVYIDTTSAAYQRLVTAWLRLVTQRCKNSACRVLGLRCGELVDWSREHAPCGSWPPPRPQMPARINGMRIPRYLRAKGYRFAYANMTTHYRRKKLVRL